MAIPRMSPRAYRRATAAALVLLCAIVVTGASVRLTGSGLGCSDWPACENDRLVAPLEFHPMVEFANRLFTGAVVVAIVIAVLGSLVRAPGVATWFVSRSDWSRAWSARSCSAGSPCSQSSTRR